MKKAIGSYFKIIFYIIMLITLFMGSQIIVSIISSIIMDEQWMEQSMYKMMILSYGVILIGLMTVNHFEKETFREAYRGFTAKQFLQAFIYVVPLWFLVGIVNGLLYPFFPEYEVEISSLFYEHERVFRFIVIVIGAPFLEEYVFRYKIQNKLKEHFGEAIAIIFQGILFGMIHSFGLQKIYASVLGIGFGWVKEKTGHILTPTVMHIVINGIGFWVGETLGFL